MAYNPITIELLLSELFPGQGGASHGAWEHPSLKIYPFHLHTNPPFSVFLPCHPHLYTSSLQGRATGNKPALWVRSRLQEELFQLGLLLQRHAGKVLFTGILLLATFTIGLKSVRLEDKIEKLWVEEGGRLDRELAYVEETLGPGSGGINQMLIQTGEGGSNLLSPESLLTHMQVLKKATRVTVEMDDV